ncbi:MAG: squalene/phytoene synthase family protein [Rhodospirillaceae bacterium]|nr:squalene/phytoene synthase family protein [Rhodospirillaceae bacterium]
MKQPMTPSPDAIAEVVRREDRDRFLTAQFVPVSARADVLALYAFNAELAKIRSHVSETMIGRIKLQWWRDVVAAIYAGQGAPKGNPITEALAAAVARHNLPRGPFDALLDARERDMDDDAPAMTMADLETYAEGTAGQLLLLALKVLEVEGAEEAARHVGIAYALSGILRAVLVHARENRLYLPGVTSVEDLRNTQATANVVAEIAALAESHLAKARALKTPRAAVPALLLGTIAGQTLKVLKAAGYDITDARVVRHRAGVARLILNAAWGTF